VVIGGRLRVELVNAGDSIRRFLARLKQAGRLLEKSDEEVNKEEVVVQKLFDEHGKAKADDPHVIALARISGSRLLASDDRRSGLHGIFKDRIFVDPPGRIYTTSDHAPLLRKAPKCKVD
jgi:hypothetical protein